MHLVCCLLVPCYPFSGCFDRVLLETDSINCPFSAELEFMVTQPRECFLLMIRDGVVLLVCAVCQQHTVVLHITLGIHLPTPGAMAKVYIYNSCMSSRY